jgi:hypothetical protein
MRGALQKIVVGRCEVPTTTCSSMPCIGLASYRAWIYIAEVVVIDNAWDFAAVEEEWDDL